MRKKCILISLLSVIISMAICFGLSACDMFGSGGGSGVGTKPSSGLEYTLSSDKMAYSVSKGTCNDTNIVIPSTHNGKPVTSINYSGFRGNRSLTNIVIPDSVISICDYAINSERDFQKTQQKTPNNIENSLQMIA